MPTTAELHPIAGCVPSRQADVIFIHGLDGDPFGTWKHDALFWPEALGLDHAQAGVWSLGYPAAKTEWNGSAMPLADRATNVLALLDAHGIGERPLVFVVHSMGGLLVKQMLRHALQYGDPAWQRISRATAGIVFLATPNSGSRIANWMTFFSLARASAAVKDLEHNDAGLRDLNLWFRNNVHQLGCRVLVFYEKLPMGQVVVVDEASSDPGIPNVVPIPLDENHATICKPASARALQYLKVKRFLEDLLPAPGAAAGTGALAPPPVAPTATYLCNVGGWKRNEINAVAWSPCSRYLAAASDDGTIRVWLPACKDLILTIHAHRGSVKSVCWSPGADALASCSTDGSAATWHFPDGRQIDRWEGADDWARSVAWAREGGFLACGYANGVVRVFYIADRRERWRLALHQGRVRSVAISPSGRMLASGATDATVKIVEPSTGTLIADIAVGALFAAGATDGAQVLCVAWAPSGAQLAVGTVSGHVSIIDTLTWRIVRSRKLCRDSILSIAWSPDSRSIACGSADRSVLQADVGRIDVCGTRGMLFGLLGTDSAGTRVAAHLGSVRSVDWSADGYAIASGSTDEVIRISTKTVLDNAELHAHQLQLRCAALSPDGRDLATGSIGRQVMLFRMHPPMHRWSLEGSSDVMESVSMGKGERVVEKRRQGLDEYIRCLAWSPDGKWLVVGGDDRTLRVLEADSGRVSHYALTDCHERSIHCVAWSPAGDRIASCSGSELVVWEVFNGVRQRRRAAGGDILAAAWAPAGDRIATVAEDGQLVLWTRLEPTTLGHCPDEVAVLSWSPDGKFVVGAGPGAHARVWDTAFGRMVAEIPVPGGVRTIAWDRAGARLALASDSGAVHIVATGTWRQAGEVASLPWTHRSLSLAFSSAPLTGADAVCAELAFSSVALA
ncbi:hypothetical protein ASC94_13390 [Massilia sp. Root418]|uniref:WD40 domain-containing protein n=1 Tax=Massilia sp. Root418 TaxID=1736532 RepID=UPI0006F6A40E|nr:PD40 domain-containing protein [Massilia sp. Root418]KQW93599.1 hypothetical protein ASC94_13390 [Massilia sp. Root418]